MKYIKRRIFFRFLVPYLLIIFITICIGYYTYNCTLSVLEQDAREMNLTILEQSCDVIDKYIAEMDRLVKNMTLCPQLNRILYMEKPFDSLDHYYVMDTQKNLESYGVLNDFIGLYYVYYQKSGIVMTPDTSYTDSEMFFEDYLKMEGLEYRNWLDSVLKKHKFQEFLPSSSVKINGVRKNYITYIQSIPLNGSQDESKGSIVVLINQTEIHKLLNKLKISDGGWYYIADQYNNIITTSYENSEDIQNINTELTDSKGSMQKELHGKQMEIAYVTSKTSGWTYVAAVPLNVVMTKVSYIKKIVYIFAAIILLAGISIAIGFSYKNSKPLNRLMDSILNKKDFSVNRKYKNSYDLIETVLNDEFDKNEYLKTKLEQHIPLLGVAFFDRLIKGEFSIESDIKTVMEHIDMNFQEEGYVPVIIQFSAYRNNLTSKMFDTIVKNKVFVKEVIKHSVSNKVYFHDVDNDKMLLLIALQKDCTEENDVRILISDLLSKLEGSIDNEVYFAVGSIYNNIIDTYKSYNSALRALEFNLRTPSNKNIIWYNEIPDQMEDYYYPLEVETHLIKLVKAGKKEETTKLLSEMFEENIFKRKLPKVMQKQFIYELQGTIIKLNSQINFTDKSKSILLDKEALYLEKVMYEDDIFNNISGIFNDMCDYVNKQKKSHNKNLEQRIVEYINLQFMDSQLSLCSVAERFDISETYLSYFFREQTGETFSHYIERIRIEYAYKLLKDKSMKVNQVSKAVGYNSDQSFRRAFKRVKNLNPTDVV